MKKSSNSAIRNLQSAIGKLYGIGIGPGDPKLLTLRAKEILDSVKTIFVPKARDGEASCARSILNRVIKKPKKYIELVFPMTKDKQKLNLSWQAAAKKVAQTIAKERDAAFVTIGDPFVYSTYIYLLNAMQAQYPNIESETIPGITSFCAASCASGIPLVKQNEKLAVLPVGRDMAVIEKTLKEFDTVVLMKVGAKLGKVIKLLKKLNLIDNSVLVSRVGHPDERIIKDVSSLKDDKLGYLSVMIIRRQNITKT
ncbi:MAG: precorrin-2 C(20)-methyltransferase [Candidatus Omnitrophota bacterium]|nr:precorrin-2 C(20)-methyltransferase [Candidatus Omnitrophota bacterium]